MKQYQLKIILKEDLHTGSGTGAGDYDSLLARDNNGLPVIPASHWLGVWRYNLSRYFQARGESDADCQALFGRVNNLCGAVTATALYSQDKTFVPLAWTSTSREPDSRAAQEDTLRTKEFIPSGSVFAATLWLADDSLGEQLKLACRLTDTLGARRQRGDGRIQAKLTHIEPQISTEAITGQFSAVRLLLRARDPICLPITGHPGNVIESECYIRGQVLRGALLAWLLRRKNNEAAQSWLDETIKVSNAYPLPCSELVTHRDWPMWQVLPMPLNVNFPKPGGGSTNGCPWWVTTDTQPNPVNRFQETGTEKLKRPADGAFLFNNGSDWQSFTADLAQRMRNSPPSTQHPDGALFTQEEIPENTRFIAEIQFPDTATADTAILALSELLAGQDCLNIGRGGAPLVIEKWGNCESPQAICSPPQTDSLTVTLTSDLIARSPFLGFYESLSPQVLLELCGLLPTLADDYNWQSQAFCDQVDVHGFNAMTGLPRIPVRAIRRGSALKISGANVDELRQALIKVKALGERSHEGFGRFSLDFSPTITTLTSDPAPFCENLAETIFAEAEKAFAELPDNTENWPKLAQWQALRFNDVADKGSLADMIKAYQDRLEKKENNAKIAWLKPMTGQRACWLTWLIAKVDVLEPNHQRQFYRALLAQIRRKLRLSGDHYDS